MDYTYDGAVNAGMNQAFNGQPLTPQGANEPWSVFQARQNAYDAYNNGG